ncbi:MAG: hypothetical protein A2Y73_02530 [Chloroflexi bacterium RBG_13_56_8]|nr:MAG: hypothetical protein A2Y73_02530 [Chloroflexi bacterium RBG_13_56_8]
MIKELVVGLAVGCVTGWIGLRSRLLSGSGAASVVLSLGLIFVGGGWVWGILTFLVYVAGGIWSRYRAADKKDRLGGLLQTERGWRQIASRVGWSAVLALIYFLLPQASSVFIAFVGALATANADMWATELGILSSRPPRLVTSGRRVSAGTPGGVSALGTVASLGAAWLVGFVGLLLVVLLAYWSGGAWNRAFSWLPLLATLGGLAPCRIASWGPLYRGCIIVIVVIARPRTLSMYAERKPLGFAAGRG